jgi:2-oxo-4-hydroxy-4-carboxy-5-ureidoimidazoline decarboxylase
MVGVDELNALPSADVRQHLFHCCGSDAWVTAMLSAMPFRDEKHVMRAAAEAADGMSADDWLAAFSEHPRIGGDLESLRRKDAAAAALAGGEQGSVKVASEETLIGLARANAEYEQKFGYIYIVCATGKAADEMLRIAQARLSNSPDSELQVAAGEQRKITDIRLAKLISVVPSSSACTHS